MIFMSQSGLIDQRRDPDWDVWYLEHLRVMASVTGIESAQRFKTDAANRSPSLAMYSMASAAVFEDPYYLSIRGLGEFREIVDHRYYHRNLFAGLDLAPAVGPDQLLLVWDRAEPREARGFEMTWLEAVAVDKSTPYRGIAVIDAARALSVPAQVGIACYRPVSRVFHK
jgi:hypothetical protein